MQVWGSCVTTQYFEYYARRIVRAGAARTAVCTLALLTRTVVCSARCWVYDTGAAGRRNTTRTRAAGTAGRPRRGRRPPRGGRRGARAARELADWRSTRAVRGYTARGTRRMAPPSVPQG